MSMLKTKTKTTGNDQKTNVFELGNEDAYRLWRDQKLANFPIQRDEKPSFLSESIVTLDNLTNPQDHEVAQILGLCEKTNMAVYQTAQPILPKTLEVFCRHLGLKTMETHRSADKGGIVAIERTSSGGKGGYIPYTDKPLSWHTDGYYNAPADRIRAMVLHCVRDASDGGVNELLDPEIVYIRLREENPKFIASLMHPKAMIIPANNDPRSDFRPDSIGPVFEVDAVSGQLNMRYSARARNIIWRDDEQTTVAREFLTHILKSDPLIVRHKLKSGQGVISNNVLHNRTGFTDVKNTDNTRLLYRIRYKERVRAGSI